LELGEFIAFSFQHLAFSIQPQAFFNRKGHKVFRKGAQSNEQAFRLKSLTQNKRPSSLRVLIYKC